MQMIENLKKIQQDFALTLIVISHDLRVILQLCQEIILLKKGKIIFQASKQEGIQDAILRDKTGVFREFLEASFQNTFLQVEL